MDDAICDQRRGKKLKVIQFMASERFGGAEKVFIDLSNELSKKHSVTALLLRDTEYKKQFLDRVEIIELESHPTRNNPFLLYEIYRILCRIKPDIVHTHGGKAAILLNRLAHFLSINHLATKHNARKGQIFNVLPNVSVVSQEALNSVKSKPGQLLRRIYNGITPQHIETQLDASVFRLAAIGRLDKIKGFDLLLEQLADVNFKFHLVIAGVGEENNHLRQRATDLRLGGRVTFAGFCTDIANLMSSSHAVVIASHSEGFPYVMVEALFYGNVLISTPVGGVVEIIPSRFLAKHDNLGRKISDVYENYDKYYKDFAGVKKSKSQYFTLCKMTDEYEKYYFQILN